MPTRWIILIYKLKLKLRTQTQTEVYQKHAAECIEKSKLNHLLRSEFFHQQNYRYQTCFNIKSSLLHTDGDFIPLQESAEP